MRIYIDGGVKRHHLKDERIAYIAIVFNRDSVIEEVGQVTNNQAEYLALIRALEIALEKREPDVEVFSDSRLLVEQFHGRYRLKSRNLIELYEKVQRLKTRFQSLTLEWISREKNPAGRLLEKEIHHHREYR